MRIRLQRGVILNDEKGNRMGNGNDPDECEIEVDEKLGKQLIQGGSADLVGELKKSERD